MPWTRITIVRVTVKPILSHFRSYESELDQLWISYAGIRDTAIKGGRQVIQFDDQRFIGNVGWRQLQQTFDSVLITHNNQQLFGWPCNAGYIGRVKTITTTTESVTRTDTECQL